MRKAILSIVAAAVGFAAALPTAAETLLYSLEVPDGSSVTYEVPFEPRHLGAGTILAEWDGHRVLAFRLESPGPWSKKYRRNGPSPQRIDFRVDERGLDSGPWKLTIFALAGAGGGSGSIRIDLPVEARPSPPPLPAPPEAPAAAPERKPWERPRRALAGLPNHWSRYQTLTEEFRRTVVDDSVPDACSWQSDFLRYLVSRLDALIEHGEPPDPRTAKLLADLAEAIDLIESLRTSRDPGIAGPPPREVKAARQWMIERRERYMVVEGKLDDLIRKIRRGHAPEVDGYEWPLRLVSCMTACERHFEARVRIGADRAANRALAAAQWERVLLARRVIGAAVDLLPD